jgi:hypothetical protein
MYLIVIKKKSLGLNKSSCSCGWYKFSTTGGESDALGRRHAQIHPEVRIAEYIDGNMVNYSGRRAVPNRKSGGIDHRDEDMNRKSYG